jgi:hypothetical protein
MGGWKIAWAVLTITLANLEKAQESRQLSQDEQEFKKYLKSNSLGMAAVQHANIQG